MSRDKVHYSPVILSVVAKCNVRFLMILTCLWPSAILVSLGPSVIHVS